jgi:positive regulator of sigma E activity
MPLGLDGSVFMEDSYLLEKIAAALELICQENQLEKIQEIVIEVSYNSPIESAELHEYLVEIVPLLVDKCTIITVNKKEEAALIYMIKGNG